MCLVAVYVRVVFVPALMPLATERTINGAHDEALSAKGTLFCCQMTQKSHWEPPSAFLNPSTLEQRAPPPHTFDSPD